jgi:secreted trypsin-like serine protease
VKAWGDLRRYLAAAVLGCALLVVLALPAIASAKATAGASIVGGREATIEEFPSLSYIEAHHGKHGFACTGTVVAPRVILTAAHCVEEVEKGTITPPNEYALSTGIADPTKATPENVFHVVANHVFPGFDPGVLHGDAAILILDRPTTAPALPMAGAADAALYGGGAEVRLAGWGLTSANAKEQPANLRMTSMLVQTPSSCRKSTRSFYGAFFPTGQVCLIASDRASGGCFGDSGGPAIAQRADGTPVELGITSTGGPSCSTRLPNVLTRVDYVSTWVSEWIAATETGAPPPVVDPNTLLPAMTTEGAEQLAVSALLNAFGKRFERASQVAGGCKKASRTRFRCKIAWITGREIYSGTVSPFYVVRQEAVGWDSHYKIEWTRLKCLQQHRHCAIHTKHG